MRLSYFMKPIRNDNKSDYVTKTVIVLHTVNMCGVCKSGMLILLSLIHISTNCNALETTNCNGPNSMGFCRIRLPISRKSRAYVGSTVLASRVTTFGL